MYLKVNLYSKLVNFLVFPFYVMNCCLQMFAIATDLVFTHFICPAIVNPEPYGITDAPISYIARFNLIQVAQILQMLAMRRYEGVDPKVEDLYSQFDKVGITRLKI